MSGVEHGLANFDELDRRLERWSILRDAETEAGGGAEGGEESSGGGGGSRPDDLDQVTIRAYRASSESLDTAAGSAPTT